MLCILGRCVDIVRIELSSCTPRRLSAAFEKHRSSVRTLNVSLHADRFIQAGDIENQFVPLAARELDEGRIRYSLQARAQGRGNRWSKAISGSPKRAGNRVDYTVDRLNAREFDFHGFDQRLTKGCNLIEDGPGERDRRKP